MASAFVPATSFLPTWTAAPTSSTCSRASSKWTMDTGAPPESRVAPFYPTKGRFLAPKLAFQDVEGIPLMNKIGLDFSEVELDYETAESILIPARAAYVKESGDFNELFTADVTDPSAASPVDRFFPPGRRDEAPIITIAAESVTVAVGAVEATPPPEATPEEAPTEGAFWKASASTPGVTSPARSAAEVVAESFGISYRNKAPVITLDSLEGISVAMEDISGEPDTPAYPVETRSMAPEILLKAPAGPWDSSGYVSVASTEVQLPLLQTTYE